MKPDYDTWYWCKTNGIRYVECEHATGKIVHFWTSGNRRRHKPTRNGTYICSVGRYLPIFYEKHPKE